MIHQIKCAGAFCDNGNPVLATVNVENAEDIKSDAFYGFVCPSCADKLEMVTEE